MKSQTERSVQRPEKQQRPVRGSKTTRRYSRQTARVEARRDGKPLIFGWGKQLSHTEKVRIQRRAVWVVTGLVALLLVAVPIISWINYNVIVPGLPITSVNGHQIPQSQYRKLVALKAEIENNKINGKNGIIAQRQNLEKQDLAQQKIVTDTQKQITSLNSQIKALPAGPSAQRTDLNNQLTAAQKTVSDAQTQHATLQQQISSINQNVLPFEQQGYTQSQIGNDSATWLQDDEIINEWLVNQSSAMQAKINPTPSAITQAMNAFKAGLPTNTSYNKFLSDDGVSDSDMQQMMALQLRRDNMQTHLSSLVVSPTYQVLARGITVATQKDAQNILTQLNKGGNFGTIAASKSLDTDTKTSGGNFGWLARGQLAQKSSQAIVENWIFDPKRTINELSPAIAENGDYHIVQILGIDPSRAVDSSTLQTLKTNALSDWLLMQRALPSMKITPVDQNKLVDPANLPSSLPASAPGSTNGTTNPAGG